MCSANPKQGNNVGSQEDLNLTMESIKSEKKMLQGIKDLANHIMLGIGACLNMSGRMVQHIAGDFPNGSPEEILSARLSQNKLVSLLVRFAPNVDRHPNMLVVVCMDSRFHVANLFSDTRAGMIDVLRSPGSIVTDETIEQIKLAVDKHHVKVVMILRHTECAMERVAADPSERVNYPILSSGVDTREEGIKKLLLNPLVRERIESRELIVLTGMVDTARNKIESYSNAMELLRVADDNFSSLTAPRSAVNS